MCLVHLNIPVSMEYACLMLVLLALAQLHVLFHNIKSATIMDIVYLNPLPLVVYSILALQLPLVSVALAFPTMVQLAAHYLLVSYHSKLVLMQYVFLPQSLNAVQTHPVLSSKLVSVISVFLIKAHHAHHQIHVPSLSTKLVQTVFVFLLHLPTPSNAMPILIALCSRFVTMEYALQSLVNLVLPQIIAHYLANKYAVMEYAIHLLFFHAAPICNVPLNKLV